MNKSLMKTVESLINRALREQQPEQTTVILWRFNRWEDEATQSSIGYLVELFKGDAPSMTLKACGKMWKITRINADDGTGFVALEPHKEIPSIKGKTPAERLKYYKDWWRNNNPYMLDEAPENPDQYTKPKHFGDVA